MKLALCGKAGSGKSTLAKMLIDEHGYVRLAFADGIKKLLFELRCKSTRIHLNSVSSKNQASTPVHDQIFGANTWIPSCELS